MAKSLFWKYLTLVNLCVVAGLGLLLRSKAIFDMPWIDYNRLVDTHGHFAFTGWVTLALSSLMVYELPGALYTKKIYRLLLGSIFLCSWAALFTNPFGITKNISEYISIILILVTYVFTFVFISDIRKTDSSKTVKLLASSAFISSALSSVGIWMLTYLFASKSLNAMLYRDALFGYLHLQYNGFFTLAVFAIIFNKIGNPTMQTCGKQAHRFALLLVSSVIPSMFITFLWHETSFIFRLLSVIGAAMLLLTFIWFILAALQLAGEFNRVKKGLRYVIILSISAFMVKILLQSLTVFDPVNIMVFGNRSLIMCFLHLVFLGFVTLFIISYYSQSGFLNFNVSFTRVAIAVFSVAVAVNEILLLVQGFGTILLTGSAAFNWYLWYAGILLVLGAALVTVAAIRSGRYAVEQPADSSFKNGQQ